MKLSILDYVPIFEGRSAHEAFQHSVELAQRAEQLGYVRYWVAEHHQVRSVASSAPEMVMMTLLEQTSNIKIGSGGVMLPHYSPYKVAEQFKMMEARHPHRVDMAIGRSPSFNNVNAALNENKERKLDFDTQLDDLNKYFNDDIDKAHRFKTLLATPLIPTKPEMYILGMSERSAKLAGKRGLPFVIAKMGQSSSAIEEVINVYKNEFARWHGRYWKSSDDDVNDAFGRTSHGSSEEDFAGDLHRGVNDYSGEHMHEASEEDSRGHVHEAFKELSGGVKPYVILATFVVTGDNEVEVEELLSALQLWLLRINYLDQPQFYPSIETAKNRVYSEREKEKLKQNKRRIIYGSPREVSRQLKDIKTLFGVDELMILPNVYGEDARFELIELLARELDI
ncbi:LLM class flavin-dependent oxidoreductase [Staphylococcus capitis]|uniref:LLM class flavin-dependent oxidoreductase n=2 Tax=Staphylococcus TaxID=1279 RepID=UPI0002E86BB0|nr:MULTISPECIES: LLM class flavin-dependent oxidoreductase [Staphylococcus]MBC3086738.1 MsnO8 family LLM class oxidoreductase [Staphylococcus capitis]MBO0370067.1 MsnO8 family LLM class oxidoreductase [Staphylococcus capitis]MBO0375907.1 MsnO8 family LLM class oxidoreductase [Staphylococcus capitis]MCI2952303.1 LLM class flavin-dependent oxidoreductase [Staphylococcus capitis]MCK6220450.1 LLM class flavin-dependent oxidoreductase [Staphylococcus capitis]